MMKSLRLSSACVGKAEARAVSKLFCANTHLGMGQEVVKFEDLLANYLNVDIAKIISVNSGTAALHLACTAACPQGGEIIVPSITYIASVQAISGAGCIPRFCEVHPNTATLDLEHAKQILSAQTKAIMPMHYAGNTCDLDAIHKFAAEHGLRVIEDAAHAFGCLNKGRKIGSFGDIICFSFDGIKNITCGEGGLIISHNHDTAKICKNARCLGIIRLDGDFDVQAQGWRYHMSNINAAIGQVQLKRLDQEFAKTRRRLLNEYYGMLNSLVQSNNIAFLQGLNSTEVIPHIFALRILNNKRDILRSKLSSMQIETAIHYKPNHLLTFYNNKTTLPISEALYTQLLTLPLHVEMQVEDVQYICHIILDFFAKDG